MARLPLVRPADMTAEQRQQYDRFPSNLTRALLLLDPRLARALPETANALRASRFRPAWREGVILRVAALSASAYERMQHLAQARKNGWSDRQITAIENGDYAVLPADFAAVLRFADECVAAPHVSGPVFAAARAVLSDRDIATLIVLVGHYMTVARLTGTLEVELDDQPDPWTSEH